MTRRLDILVLSDLHARTGSPDATLLARKALQHLRRRGVEPGLVVALGDLCDEGDPERTPGEALRGTLAGLRGLGLPLLALPGNHDGPPARFVELGGTPAGLHEAGGHGFLVFHDQFLADGRCRREAGALGLPARVAAARPDLPLVALQHAHLHPVVDDPFPYRPDNAAEILASYREAGVVLALGGHYHAGAPPHEAGGVPVVHTVPALSAAPFRYAHVRLEGRAARVETHALGLPPGLWDLHNHTEFSYCGGGTSAGESGRIGALLGLSGMAFAEHAFQLYLESKPAWSFAWQREEREWRPVRERGGGRMAAYRALAASLRGPSRRFGLELDLCADGEFLLRPEDRAGWDLLVGSVHEIPGAADGPLTPARAERLFLRDTERILALKVDILAHPLRWWEWKKVPLPAHLPGTVARMLAAAGVAGEINFHNATTPPELVRAYLEHGVRISLGADAHAPEEAADLWPHLRALAAAGVRAEDLPGLLFVP